MAAYGSGNFGVGQYSDPRVGYGYGSYGVGNYSRGTFEPAVNITATSTMAVAGSTISNAQFEIFDQSTMAVAAIRDRKSVV